MYSKYSDEIFGNARDLSAATTWVRPTCAVIRSIKSTLMHTDLEPTETRAHDFIYIYIYYGIAHSAFAARRIRRLAASHKTSVA